MANIKILLKATLILGFVVIIVSILDFLALHDIHKDYVSKEMLASLSLPVAKLPLHSETPGEWLMVSFSFISKILFLMLNSIALILGLKYLNYKAAEQAN